MPIQRETDGKGTVSGEPMKKWKVPLAGHRRDFPQLPILFDAPELQIVRRVKDGHESFDLESTDFASFSSWDEVYSHALNLLAIINGIARIKISGFSNIRLWYYIVGVEEDGTEQHFVIPDSDEETRTDQTELVADYMEAKDWLRRRGEKPEIETALTIFSFADTWVVLYLVLDFIQTDVGGQKALARMPWVTTQEAAEIKRFTHTANNFRTLGVSSRHAITDFEPPTCPMRLSDAKHLIFTLLVKWLRAKMA
jgi:hypothetical protein